MTRYWPIIMIIQCTFGYEFCRNPPMYLLDCNGHAVSKADHVLYCGDMTNKDRDYHDTVHITCSLDIMIHNN